MKNKIKSLSKNVAALSVGLLLSAIFLTALPLTGCSDPSNIEQNNQSNNGQNSTPNTNTDSNSTSGTGSNNTPSPESNGPSNTGPSPEITKIPVSIKIINTPTKAEYFIGEYLDPDGLEVEATFDDESKEIIGNDKLAIDFINEPFDSEGDITVNVSYSDSSDTFTVTVKTPITYTVTFNTNGGISEVDPLTITVTQPATTVGSLPTDPTKTGYHLSSWNTKANGSGDSFTADTTVESDITVYAQWEINTYIVTFDNNGTTLTTQKVNHGEKATRPTNPTKPTNLDQYNTVGWYTDNGTFASEWNFNTAITSNTTLYARWRIYKIGDVGPGGGQIFYYEAKGFTVKGSPATTAKYLEASPEDLGSVKWGQTSFNDETGDGIGEGKKNTQIIVTAYKDNESGTAAQVAANYNGGGLNDWFLPSDSELDTLFKNRVAAGITLAFSSSTRPYWSSSESAEGNYSYAVIYYITSSSTGAYTDSTKHKNGDALVRAIRAF